MASKKEPIPDRITMVKTRAAQLRVRENEIVRLMLAAEANGAPPRRVDDDELRAAAAKLLNGGFSEKHQPAANLYSERRAVALAIEMADAEVAKLTALDDVTRWNAGADEWADSQSQIALCLLSLERCLKARDDLWEKLRPRAGFGTVTNPNQQWRFERLGTRGGPAYSFCKNAVQNGWVAKQDFEELIAIKKDK